MTRKRVLLLGGTGAMGIYLAPELAACGYDVVVTSRSSQPAIGTSLRYVRGDARDPSFLRSVLESTAPDAVVDFMSYTTAEFAARRDLLLGSTGHYLFLSSYRVFADSSPYPITERSPRLLDSSEDTEYLSTDEYALTKARQEDLLWDSARSNWTILRPCITYSKNRFQFGTLEANTVCFRAMQGLPVIMAREILDRETTMTWGGDVARLIARLVLNPSALGEDYNVVTAEHQTWARVAQYYREFLGLSVIETDLSTYIHVVGSPYQVLYDRMFHRVLDNTKVLNATGLTQAMFVPLEAGLKRELSRFLEKPVVERANLASNARMDMATNTRISLKGVTFEQRASYYRERYPILSAALRGLRTGRAIVRRCCFGR